MRRKRGSLTREEILTAAMDIVTHEGLEKLTMRQIAQKLSCSVASPYAHFKNREEIARELILHGEKELTNQLKSAREQSSEVFEQLSLLAHAYWDYATQNRELHKLMMNMGSRFYRRTFRTQPPSYRLFLNTIKKGMQNGSIHYPREEYSSIARTMWSWLYGLVVLEMGDVLPVREDRDFIDQGVALFTKVLQQGLANE